MDDLKYDRDSVTNKIEKILDFLKVISEELMFQWVEFLDWQEGKTNLPLSGGPGTLRAMYYKKSGKKYKAVAGDCYIQAVEWSPEKTIKAWSVHQYGSATKNKTSIHYDDQAEMFSKHKMKLIRP